MPDAAPGRPELLAALRAATHALHSQAERSGFVATMLAGGATRGLYAIWLRNLLHAYEHLEAALRGLDQRSALRPLADPRVYRADALAADLAVLAGPSFRALPVLREAEDYAADLDAADDAGLIAHAYVRYLGDLNGGQAMRRILGRSPGLGAECLAFYAFPAEAVTLERDYRRSLGAAGLSLASVEHAAAAAARAFRLNIALSTAIAAHRGQER
jgi:heme oxygenase